MKFVFRSRDLEEIKATLRFLGLEPEDEENQRRIRELENGQCLFQDTKGHTGVMQVHPVFQEYGPPYSAQTYDVNAAPDKKD